MDSSTRDWKECSKIPVKDFVLHAVLQNGEERTYSSSNLTPFQDKIITDEVRRRFLRELRRSSRIHPQGKSVILASRASIADFFFPPLQWLIIITFSPLMSLVSTIRMKIGSIHQVVSLRGSGQNIAIMNLQDPRIPMMAQRLRRKGVYAYFPPGTESWTRTLCQ